MEFVQEVSHCKAGYCKECAARSGLQKDKLFVVHNIVFSFVVSFGRCPVNILPSLYIGLNWRFLSLLLCILPS